MIKLFTFSVSLILSFSVGLSYADTTLNDFRNAVVNKDASGEKNIPTEKLLEDAKSSVKPPIVTLDGFDQGGVSNVVGSGNSVVDKQLSDAFNAVVEKKVGVAQVTEVKKSRFTELKYNSSSINYDTNIGVKKELEYADKLSGTMNK